LAADVTVRVSLRLLVSWLPAQPDRGAPHRCPSNFFRRAGISVCDDEVTV